MENKQKTKKVTDHPRQNAQKGSIKLEQRPERRWIRYTYHKKRYIFTLPMGEKQYPQLLEKDLCALIAHDVRHGIHDNSKQKYEEFVKQWLKEHPNAERETGLIEVSTSDCGSENVQPVKAVLLNGDTWNDHSEKRSGSTQIVHIVNNVHYPQQAAPFQPMSAIERPPLILYEELKAFCKANARTFDAAYYYNTYQMLVRWGKDTKPSEVAEKLKNEGYKATTHNPRMGLLSTLFEWLIAENKLDKNPLKFAPTPKKDRTKPPERRRLYDNEIIEILEAVKTDRFTNKNAHRVKHSDYYGLLLFLCLTGSRPSEGTSLQVKKIDFKRKTFTVDTAYDKKLKKLKGTKTEECRVLRFDSHPLLEEVFRQGCAGKGPDDFVFTNYAGNMVNTRNLNDKFLRPILKGLGIPNRVTYVMRHSFISRCVRNKMDIKSIMALTGHTDHKMILQVYAEVEKEDILMPQLDGTWMRKKSAEEESASAVHNLPTSQDLMLFSSVSSLAS